MNKIMKELIEKCIDMKIITERKNGINYKLTTIVMKEYPKIIDDVVFVNYKFIGMINGKKMYEMERLAKSEETTLHDVESEKEGIPTDTTPNDALNEYYSEVLYELRKLI